MLTSTTLLTLLATAGTTLAAPTSNPNTLPVRAIHDAFVPAWSVGYTRSCPSDASCLITLHIEAREFASGEERTHKQSCQIVVQATSGGPIASQTAYTGRPCGIYTVGSSWSGQFGPGNGFTTLSVVETEKNLIVWPAWSDAEVPGEGVGARKVYTPVYLGDLQK